AGTITPFCYETALILRGAARSRKRFGPERSDPLPCPHRVRSRVSTARRFDLPARGRPAIPSAPGVHLHRGPCGRYLFHYRESAIGRIGGHRRFRPRCGWRRSEEHTSELQSLTNLVCRLL